MLWTHFKTNSGIYLVCESCMDRNHMRPARCIWIAMYQTCMSRSRCYWKLNSLPVICIPYLIRHVCHKFWLGCIEMFFFLLFFLCGGETKTIQQFTFWKMWTWVKVVVHRARKEKIEINRDKVYEEWVSECVLLSNRIEPFSL